MPTNKSNVGLSAKAVWKETVQGNTAASCEK